jgi:hypothetical protein
MALCVFLVVGFAGYLAKNSIVSFELSEYKSRSALGLA